MALPQSAAVDSAVILFFFKKMPPHKKPKTKPVALKCPSVIFKTDVLHSEAAAVYFTAASPNILDT